MNYESIDPIILGWTASHALHLYTTSRDEEVRSVDLIGANGLKCQIWIEAPDNAGDIQVHVWDYKKRKQNHKVKAGDLLRCLEDAHMIAKKWLETQS